MAITKIIENKRITPTIQRMVMEEENIARNALPGQFVNIRVGNGYYPLLRRPMSIHYTEGKRFAILYNIRGLGTELLSLYKKGDKLDVLGPLGKPFNSLIRPNETKLYLIAGGMGIAPLYFLWRGHPAYLIIGARNRDGILPNCRSDFCRSDFCRSDFLVTTIMETREEGRAKREKGHGQQARTTDTVLIITEDGSLGKRGIVTDYLPDVFEDSTIIACGPNPMLKKVKEFYANKSATCILSLEARMGCGYGACLSCAVKTKDGYRYVCKDGPAFYAGDVEFD